MNIFHIGGLVQKRCNSIANALELRLSSTKPSILCYEYDICSNSSKIQQISMSETESVH